MFWPDPQNGDKLPLVVEVFPIICQRVDGHLLNVQQHLFHNLIIENLEKKSIFCPLKGVIL
jgi:hypothetical protein